METLDVSPTSKSVVEKVTVNGIRAMNGIEYAPEFTLEGLEVPIVLFDGCCNNPYLLLIPKSKLIAMLKEYLPEMREEIRSIVKEVLTEEKE